MEEKIKAVNNKNDYYIYFEIINQIEPSSVLDLGSFLKAAGAISRNIMDISISEEIILDSLDFCPKNNILVYEKIYNSIYTEQEIDELLMKNYELIVSLNAYDYKSSSWLRDFYIKFKDKVHWILTKADILDIKAIGPFYDTKPIYLDQDAYLLLTSKSWRE